MCPRLGECVGVPVLKAACASEGVTTKGPWSGRVTFLAHDPVHTGQRVLYCVGREGSVKWAALSLDREQDDPEGVV